MGARLLLVAALVLAMPVSGEPLQLEAPAHVVLSVDEPVPLIVTAMISCEELRPSIGEPRVVQFELRAEHSAIVLTGPRAMLVPADACGPLDETATVSGTFNATATQVAPGERPIELQTEAQLSRDALHPPSPRALARTVLEVAYHGSIEARTPAAIVVGDGRAKAEIHLVNHFNARTRVAFVSDDPGFHAVDVILESPMHGDGHTEAVVPVLYQPRGSWEERTVQVRVEPDSARQATAGEPVIINFLFRNSAGLFAEAPGPGLPLLVAALLLARRRL